MKDDLEAWVMGYRSAIQSVKELVLIAEQRINDPEAHRELENLWKEIDQLQKSVQKHVSKDTPL